MYSVEYETGEKGLRAIVKDYQEIALRELWKSSTGLNSRQVWTQVNEKLKTSTISRASIINFLEAMRELGVLSGKQVTGKGGHRWIYSPAMDESGFKQYVADTLLGCLKRDFPEETKQAIKKLQ
jgi:hypothetical protein